MPGSAPAPVRTPATAPTRAATIEPTEKGRRLSPTERHNQLVSVGLELAKAGSVMSLTAAEVADAADVSKGLVFHYFPTQVALHAEVARAAARELIELLAATDPDLPHPMRVAQGLDVFFTYIEKRPAIYLSFARSAGVDPQLQAVFDETRAAVLDLIARAIGIEVLEPRLRLFFRGWIATVEEMALDWLDTHAIERAELIEILCRAAFQFVVWAQPAYG